MSPKLEAEMRKQNHLNGWGARAVEVEYLGPEDLDFDFEAESGLEYPEGFNNIQELSAAAAENPELQLFARQAEAARELMHAHYVEELAFQPSINPTHEELLRQHLIRSGVEEIGVDEVVAQLIELGIDFPPVEKEQRLEAATAIRERATANGHELLARADVLVG